MIQQYLNITMSKELDNSSGSNKKGVNKSFILVNSSGKKFIFKPQNGEHTSKWRYIPAFEQYKRERAAFLVSSILGWGLVPNTKIFSFKDELGSLQDWVENTEKADKTLAVYSADTIWKSGLFDILIGNADRHSKNWLTLNDKAVMIDNGYSFPFYCDINDPRSVILSRFSFKIWELKIPQMYIDNIRYLKSLKIQGHLKDLLDFESFKLFIERLMEVLETRKAFVTKYQCVERVKGTPLKKQLV